VSRLNDPGQRVVAEVPELRVINDGLWRAVKARQAAASRVEGVAVAAFQDRSRPRYLLSGLMRCGACGGGFAEVSAHHFGCSTARDKGTCANRLTIRRDALEATVLDALRHRLMDPALYAVFVAESAAEWNRLQAEAGLAARRTELADVRRRIEGLTLAIEEGLYEPKRRERMRRPLERRREALEAEVAAAREPEPRLHPGLADVYRAKVAALREALVAEDGHEAREVLRPLVEAVVLVPEGRKLAIEVRGNLAAILALGQARAARPRARGIGRPSASSIRSERLTPEEDPPTFTHTALGAAALLKASRSAS
jgi:site-specific DNA recombinase